MKGEFPLQRLFLLFAHELTPAQTTTLRIQWQIEEIIIPPDNLREDLRTVPSRAESLQEYVDPVVCWLEREARNGDLALVQGEYGVVYLLVQHCFRLGITPVYATSKRELAERLLPDGSVETVRKFKPIGFRRYERI